MLRMAFYDQIAANQRRTYLLVLAFLVLLAFLGYVLGIVYGNRYFGLFLALGMGLLYFLFSYYAGASAILAMTRAQEATKPEYTHLINTVEGLALAAGLPKPPKAYVIDDSALNAFASGRNPAHSVIAVTTGLLKKMNKLELEGVLAHEMSHIKNYDIRVMMLAAVMVGTTVLLSDFLLRSFWYGGHGNRRGKGGGAVLLLVAVALAVLAPLIGELIKLAISRQREFLADASAVQLTRYPQGLANALRKIKDDPDPLVDYANKATAHLFISSPFRKSSVAFRNLFSTHPPLDIRIKRIEAR